MKTSIYSSKIAILLIVFLLSSCKYKTYYPYNFEFDFMEVTALDLEEDGYLFSTGDDEIEIYYSLAALDKNNNPVGPVRKRHYSKTFYDKGDYARGFSSLSVKVPAKGKVYFSMCLIENDDYFAVSQAIDDLETVVDVAKFVSRNKKKGSLTARSLRMASRTLTWLGIAVTVVDIIDTNDKLMGICIVLDEDQLQELSRKGRTNLTARGKGSNWGDTYDYAIDFGLLARQAYGEPIRERIKAKRKAPNVYANFSPFIIDQHLNEFWQRSPDRLIEKSKTEGGESQWSDGLYNNNLSVSFGIGVSPAFKIKNSTVGKFYLEGTYRKLPYVLNTEKEIFLSNFYLQNDSGTAADISINKITLDVEQYRAAATFKIISQSLVWEMGGGVLYNKAGRTKFSGVTLGNPDAKFIYDNTQNVLEENYTSFAFSKIGYGRINGTKGATINFGVMAFKPNFEVNNLYGLKDSNGKNIPTSVDNYRLSYSFGLDFYF